MNMNDRQAKILQMLGENEEISVNKLSAYFNVSAVTIRGDLDYLENRGLLKRVHGGAVLNNEDDIMRRIGVNFAVKTAIAAFAASMIAPNDIIFIDSGSANVLLARQLLKNSGAQVVTNNTFVARQLKGSPVEVILLGGVYQQDSECVVGSLAELGLGHLNFSKAFIGVDGITADHGFTCSNMMRADIARRAAKKAKTTYVLSDSTKIGKTSLCQICSLRDIDYLITDNLIKPEQKSELEAAGIEVLICATQENQTGNS